MFGFCSGECKTVLSLGRTRAQQDHGLSITLFSCKTQEALHVSGLPPKWLHVFLLLDDAHSGCRLFPTSGWGRPGSSDCVLQAAKG
mmetsp:Transcript_167084/g.536576  ORF Transcript_167084/g.536576 Transcript_167084/m.536576 type:complete len:86 (+) Transcript_167084:733-990(+)